MGFNPSLTLRLSDIQSRASQKSCALFSDQSSRSSTEKDFLHPLQREARCRSAAAPVANKAQIFFEHQCIQSQYAARHRIFRITVFEIDRLTEQFTYLSAE